MRRAHLIDLSLILLLAGPLVAAEPSKFTLAIPATVDPLTVLGPAGVCADQQIALWNGASATQLQCSVLTVADTTGNITGPSGGFSIIGGTAASDALTLDSTSNATNGAVQVAVGNSFRLYGLGSGTTDTEYIELTSVAGTGFTLRPVTNGTGGDNLTLTLSGEGPAGTLILDGSDDVAGSVTVSAAGGISLTGGLVEVRHDAATANNTLLSAGSAGTGFFNACNGSCAGFSSDGPVVVVGDLTIYGSAANGIDFEGTDNAHEIELLAVDATADRTITLPDASGTVLLNVRVVTPDIDGETTTLANSATVWTNTGDGDGEAITLLNDPTVGTNYCFAVDAAQTITVAPSTGESLYYGTDQCVVSLTSNSIGSTLCVTAISGGSGAKWFTMSHEGSWTCND